MVQSHQEGRRCIRHRALTQCPRQRGGLNKGKRVVQYTVAVVVVIVVMVAVTVVVVVVRIAVGLMVVVVAVGGVWGGGGEVGD